MASLIAAISMGLSSIGFAQSPGETSPWGMSSSSEWFGEYPRFNPMIREAGVTWLRYFPEWQSIQRAPGEWNWERGDKLVADIRKNNMRLSGIWAYFAPFASQDGSSRKGPIKDMNFWREYVRESAKRYKDDIKYWEVWNEFNVNFYQGKDKIREYADLVVAAYEEVKKIDPTIKVGLSTANTDVGFLDAVIKAGAANHFDFIAVHPYELADSMMHGDIEGYMGIAHRLREMLAINKQKVDMPLWMTEVGTQAPVNPDPEKDARQAEAIVRVYTMALAQGFDKIQWFEARGPAYGAGTDHGIIRKDWSTRPAYDALKTMITTLGEQPKFLGWHKQGKGLFLTFKNGEKSVVYRFEEGQPMVFTDRSSVDESKLSKGLLEPDLSKAESIRNDFKSSDGGLKQIILRKDHENRTEKSTEGVKVISMDRDKNVAYFRANPTFLTLQDSKLEITIVAKRINADTPAEIGLTYETQRAYKHFKTGGEAWRIGEGDGWQEHTWKIDDAYFASRWGWNFAIVSMGETKELLIKEVRVKKAK